MKTKYLAEAQLATLLDTTRLFSNNYFLDVTIGTYFVGLLSALPLDNKDGWEGARELFSTTTGPYLPGIKDPSVNTGSYQPEIMTKGDFILPTLVDSNLGLSGMLTEYRKEITFPVATSNWGNILGLVVYALRGSRITPLFTIPFVAPANVLTNDQVTIRNEPNTRMRVIELIKKNTI
jgi:hypothetical protein